MGRMNTIIATESLTIQNQSNFYVLVIAFIELQILMGPQSKKATVPKSPSRPTFQINSNPSVQFKSSSPLYRVWRGSKERNNKRVNA